MQFIDGVCPVLSSQNYLQVVVAHRSRSGGQVVVHTLAKAAQAGGIGGAAGQRARRGPQQQAAGTRGVLAGAVACRPLQRHGPTESRSFRVLVKVQPEEMLSGVCRIVLFDGHLAEQMPEGLAWQYSLVHSG